MAGSRWADTAEDAVLDAKRRREKEEKKRLRVAEKARKAAEIQATRQAEQAEQAEEQAATTSTSSPRDRTLQSESQQQQDEDHAGARPPAKRRKLTPQPTDENSGSNNGIATINAKSDGESDGTSKRSRLLWFEAPTWKAAQTVENYDKLNDIEEGAYGWVARARCRRSGEIVALKRLKLDGDCAHAVSSRAGLPETGLREIQILKDCRQHRNIVGLREVVINDAAASLLGNPIESVFLVLDFIEHDLKSLLEDQVEPFLASEIKMLLKQLCAGVSFLHSRWVLHRDIKTSNLLLNNRGVLKIADFGMARYTGDPPGDNLTGLVVTLWYRAPELLLGTQHYGRAIDMWSVGCVFGELLSRDPLLQGRNEVDQLSLIFDLLGVPTDESWPGFRRLPNARSLKLPSSSGSSAPAKHNPAQPHPALRAKFPLLTVAGAALLSSLLAPDPERRPSADEVLQHEYFSQDPRPKHETLFPTFPSKAGQERRRRRETPNAPARSEQQQGRKNPEAAGTDFSGIFTGREKEERGAGFALRMV